MAATAAMSGQQKDEALTQFLSMTEDRVDPDVARNLLEVVGWDVRAAVEQLYGGAVSPGQSRPATATLMQEEEAVRFSADANPPAGGTHITSADPSSVPDDSSVFIDTASEGTAPAVPGAQMHSSTGGHEDMDAQLAAAIEASYHAQTDVGMEASEEELLAQAMRISQQEEDMRQRASLREQQEQELAESILMDQMREQREREERLAAEEAVRLADQQRIEEEQRAVADLEAKRARLPAEPPVGEAGRLAIMLRLPGGQRLQRAFRSTDPVGVLYDFVDLQSSEVAGQRYRLVSTMPRKAYEDRQQTLAEAGIQNQFVLMLEQSSGL